MDKSRQRFEGWINKNHPKCSYYHKDIRLEAWVASRESLEVELPVKLPTMDDDSFEEGLCEGYNNAIDDCKQILISNGVRIKNE